MLLGAGTCVHVDTAAYAATRSAVRAYYTHVTSKFQQYVRPTRTAPHFFRRLQKRHAFLVTAALVQSFLALDTNSHRMVLYGTYVHVRTAAYSSMIHTVIMREMAPGANGF